MVELVGTVLAEVGKMAATETAKSLVEVTANAAKKTVEATTSKVTDKIENNIKDSLNKSSFNPDSKAEVSNTETKNAFKKENSFNPDSKAEVSKKSDTSENSTPDSKGEVNKEIKGGSYNQLKEAGHDHGHIPPEEKHHMPAWEAMENTTKIEYGDCPAIAMEKDDHKQTASWGNSLEAREYRAEQARLIKEGKIEEAMQMDIDDIHDKFGDKYDEGIQEMKDYYNNLKEEGRV